MKTGIISMYNEDRGFGFIRETGEKLSHIFFHVKYCLCVPKKGLQVQFEIGHGRKGHQAISVDVNAAETLFVGAR
jgi:cold shock CspA family protein